VIIRFGEQEAKKRSRVDKSDDDPIACPGLQNGLVDVLLASLCTYLMRQRFEFVRSRIAIDFQ